MPSTCANTAGDVVEFSGGDGTGSPAQLDNALSADPLCFRLLDVLWDSAWEDDGSTNGGPAGQGGNVLAASGRAHALIEWIHAYERSSASTPFCARGSSGGSSLLLYELLHGSGDALFDHVQLRHATPFARIDKGCDPSSPAEGMNVVCSGLPASTEPQYNGAAGLVRKITHDSNCDVAGGSLASQERTALHAMSVITPGLGATTLHRTSVSVFMCSMNPNATQGQAVDVFGVDADLASAGTASYGGVLDVKLAAPFNGCAAGAECPPHVSCSAACSGESFGSVAADRQQLLQDMHKNCVLRH